MPNYSIYIVYINPQLEIIVHITSQHTHTHAQLLSLGIATSGLSELIVAIRRSQDQHSLLEKIVPHLEKLLQVDINIDKSKPLSINC